MISVKRHIYDAKKLRLGHVLPLSVGDSVISLFLEGFIFHKTSHMRSFMKIKTLAKISEFTVSVKKENIYITVSVK